MSARLHGLPLEVAWACQAIMSAAMVGVPILIFRKRPDPLVATPLFVAASLLASPYAFVYDMTALSVSLAALLGSSAITRSDACLAILVWCLPALTILQPTTGPLFCGIVLLVFVARLTLILSRSPKPAALDPPEEPTSVQL